MIAELDQLNQDEKELMLKVPLLVTILIAGADNNIDRSETKEAISIVKNKRTRARKELLDYYKEVGEDFEDKLKILIHSYPTNTGERNQQIIEELKELNNILPKLSKGSAVKFYESIKDIAKKIAEASGGILGYMSVSYEESKLVDLKMIKNPAK